MKLGWSLYVNGQITETFGSSATAYTAQRMLEALYPNFYFKLEPTIDLEEPPVPAITENLLNDILGPSLLATLSSKEEKKLAKSYFRRLLSKKENM